MKKISGKDIAISGISAGLAIIAILLSIYLNTLTITLYVISALSISLPLLKERILSSILSYVSASLIGFILASIKILPFIFFFGLYSIVEWLLDFKFYNIEKLDKKIKITFIVVVKIAYFLGVYFACFFLMNLVLSDMSISGFTLNIFTFLIICLVVFVVYDYAYRKAFILMQKVILPRIEKK